MRSSSLRGKPSSSVCAYLCQASAAAGVTYTHDVMSDCLHYTVINISMKQTNLASWRSAFCGGSRRPLSRAAAQQIGGCHPVSTCCSSDEDDMHKYLNFNPNCTSFSKRKQQARSFGISWMVQSRSRFKCRASDEGAAHRDCDMPHGDILLKMLSLAQFTTKSLRNWLELLSQCLRQSLVRWLCHSMKNAPISDTKHVSMYEDNHKYDLNLISLPFHKCVSRKKVEGFWT